MRSQLITVPIKIELSIHLFSSPFGHTLVSKELEIATNNWVEVNRRDKGRFLPGGDGGGSVIL